MVDDIAADLPSVSNVLAGADPKLLDGAQDHEHVYIRPEVFTSSLETIGLADRKAEVERLLYPVGMLLIVMSMPPRTSYGLGHSLRGCWPMGWQMNGVPSGPSRRL
jgi:hypothetical protein